MARKSVADLKSAKRKLEQAIEEFEATSEVKYDLAKAAYDVQDAKTQQVIDRIVATLRTYATGYVTFQLAPPRGAVEAVKITNEYLGYNLFYLAVEVVKDLAIMGIRVAEFEFPPALCSNCGVELDIPELKKVKR
jgi:hypothetical protein